MQNIDRYLVVSSDGHAGLPLSATVSIWMRSTASVLIDRELLLVAKKMAGLGDWCGIMVVVFVPEGELRC